MIDVLTDVRFDNRVLDLVKVEDLRASMSLQEHVKQRQDVLSDSALNITVFAPHLLNTARFNKLHRNLEVGDAIIGLGKKRHKPSLFAADINRKSVTWNVQVTLSPPESVDYFPNRVQDLMLEVAAQKRTF